jgi:tRNA A37 threonylcarbamoyladenosine dehydratase
MLFAQTVTHVGQQRIVRYRLRKEHGGARTGPMGVACVFSREPVTMPDGACVVGPGDGSLNCHGYGSVVSVTATFGLVAAGAVLNALAHGDAHARKNSVKNSPT